MKEEGESREALGRKEDNQVLPLSKILQKETDGEFAEERERDEKEPRQVRKATRRWWSALTRASQN